jgi:hypothetical protein
MLTKKFADFSADLLDAVRGVLGEAKKCEDCGCAKCECEDEEDEVEEGYIPTSDEPSEKDKKTADKVRALLAKEKKPVKEEIDDALEAELKAQRQTKKSVADAKKKYAKEEVEQIDELSKGTLGSYIKKASNQVLGKGIGGGMALARNNAEGEAEGHKLVNKAVKRMSGVQKAADKLTKEEQDFIDALNDETFDEIAEAEKNLTGLPKSTAEKNKQYIEVTHVSGNKKRVPVHPTMAYKALNRYRNDVTTKSARIVSEETEITEARGRPKKNAGKDFTIHPKTKEKLYHSNPEHMARIEKLQKNGILPKPKTEAGQHIINQLRKASTSMQGGSTVHFTHGDSKHVSAAHASKALDKYAGMKPNEKEDFQKKIGHSHEQLMKHI